MIKPWYARTVVDGKKSLSDVFTEFSSGEFDEGEPIEEKYQYVVFDFSNLIGIFQAKLFSPT